MEQANEIHTQCVQNAKGSAVNSDCENSQQEMYLEHLMNMMVNVMDRGFQEKETC